MHIITTEAYSHFDVHVLHSPLCCVHSPLAVLEEKHLADYGCAMWNNTHTALPRNDPFLEEIAPVGRVVY